MMWNTSLRASCCWYIIFGRRSVMTYAQRAAWKFTEASTDPAASIQIHCAGCDRDQTYRYMNTIYTREQFESTHDFMFRISKRDSQRKNIFIVICLGCLSGDRMRSDHVYPMSTMAAWVMNNKAIIDQNKPDQLLFYVNKPEEKIVTFGELRKIV